MIAANEAARRSVVLGTAGHVDHGKTMLIHALTGTDTDRLPEEKRRGITVDLGFAALDVQTSSGSQLRVDVIDVPGHKQFVRNMLAGAGGIDAVLLVISAQEGVMPQTEEHLVICNLLGIRRGLTVLTKCDLVSEEDLAAVRERIRSALDHSFLKDAPILAVSARTGFGFDDLRTELARLAESVPARDSSGLPRLPLDRSFVMKGFGTVATGTLQSGSLSIGQILALEPGGRQVRVRGLQRQGHSQHEAFAGSRVALNLSGIEVKDIQRGATLVLPQSLRAANLIDAEITLLPGAPELPHRGRVRLHSFTSESVATASVYGYHAVPSGATQIVRLKLAHPMLLLPGDRFVLRRLSPAQTIGGGRVLDATPVERTPRKHALAWLEQIRDAAPAEQVRLRVERRGSVGISTVHLAEEFGWTAELIGTMIQPMLASGMLRLLAHHLLVTRRGLEEAGKSIQAHIAQSPEAAKTPSGMRRSELRSLTHLSTEVFDAALELLLAARHLVARGEPGQEHIYPPGAVPEAVGPNQKKVEALAEVYRRAGLNPPGFAEVLRDLRFAEKDARAFVTELLRSETLVKVGQDDVFMHGAALDNLKSSVRKLRGQTLDVSRLKQMTGLSRKYAIPLLEYLDRQRITRRQGDARVVL